MGKDGELVACLKQSFLAYQNSFRLALAAAYEYGEKGKGKLNKKPLDLESYLRRKERDEQDLKIHKSKEEPEHEGRSNSAEEEAGPA